MACGSCSAQEPGIHCRLHTSATPPANPEHANAAADGLRAELDKTKRLAEHYTGSFPTGTPASKVIGVLADMLEESNRSYIAAAEEAERYRSAGLTCERQYDSLKAGH